jgi:Uma2 family endonuclease
MSVSLVPDVRMNVGAFLAWSELDPEPEDLRYELVHGEVVAAPRAETIGHNRAKGAAGFSLYDAARAAGLPCVVLFRGMGVAINDDTVRLPDVVVLRGPMTDLDAVLVEEPLIVVEVVSTESEASDAMLRDYASVASIRHYLISNWESRTVIHYHRNESGPFDPRILKDGDIVLDPPRLSVSVAAFLGEED